jgi:peptidylprolyl isomerase
VWLWDGAPLESSWESGKPYSFRVGADEAIDGWDEGVVGQPVGSRILLVVPPDKGYGDEGYGPIPGGSTLVFAMDILVAF